MLLPLSGMDASSPRLEARSRRRSNAVAGAFPVLTTCAPRLGALVWRRRVSEIRLPDTDGMEVLDFALTRYSPAAPIAEWLTPQNTAIPVLPALAGRVIEVASDPDVSLVQLANLIGVERERRPGARAVRRRAPVADWRAEALAGPSPAGLQAFSRFRMKTL